MSNKLTLEQIKDELKDLLGDKSVDKSVEGLPYVVIIKMDRYRVQ